jgi:hypothetical protein
LHLRRVPDPAIAEFHSRDAATASRAAWRYSFSSFSRSRAATHAPACSENPSTSAHSGPFPSGAHPGGVQHVRSPRNPGRGP